MRRKIIVGNWKLNSNKSTIKTTINKIQTNLKNSNNKCDIIIAPPLVYLETTKKYLKNSKIHLCAQNVDIHLYGAFTGETSANMLKDIGVKYVIIGHSERRIFHNENSTYIAKKLEITKKAGLTPILCIGENKLEQSTDYSTDVCIKQLDTIINNLGINILKNTIIAYEPVWAIGNKQAAATQQIQKTHSAIRKYIDSYDKEIAKCSIIQYGGSVNPNNIKDIITQPDVDGVLVGKSSLNPNDFVYIINYVEQISK